VKIEKSLAFYDNRSMEKMLLIYWTGTYNTRYITNLVKNAFVNEYQIDLVEVNKNTNPNINVDEYSLVGIGYPIYGFNVPGFFGKFIKKLKWNSSSKVFIYKNSGETYHLNDSSSISLVRFFKRKCHIKITNEYHFMMPYNIHFKFEDNLVKEILDMDDKLCEILHYEISNNVANLKKFKMKYNLLTRLVSIVHIGGNVNSFLYKIDKSICIKCMKCVNECPMNNIYIDKKNRIRLHHHCQMCMRCSFYCPTDAFSIGYVNGWKVNGRYDLSKIKQIQLNEKVITKDTKGFFKCYVESFEEIDTKFNQITKK